MSWWRRHWRLALAIAVSTIGLAVLAVLYVLRKDDEVDRLTMELDMFRAGARVDGLKADKAARATELSKNTLAKKSLDNEIATAKRKAVAIVKEVEGMTDIDIAIEFRKLGY